MLDYIIIGLLIIVIILVIIAISKNVNEGKITERLGTLETTTVKELSSFQIDIMMITLLKLIEHLLIY